MESEKVITTTWLSNKDGGSCQIVIPKEMAMKYGIYNPSRISIEEADDGSIIIRKMPDL